jgi:hypothetical protein
MNPYVQYENVIPLIAPVDTAATAISTPYVDLKTAHEASFLVQFGVITTGTADSNVTVTVEAATVQAGTGAAAIGFSYRLSDAVGANAWGAITACAATGLAIGSTDDGKALEIEIDPAAVQAAKADARWVRVTITPTADHTVTLLSALVAINPRYKQSSMVSAT